MPRQLARSHPLIEGHERCSPPLQGRAPPEPCDPTGIVHSNLETQGRCDRRGLGVLRSLGLVRRPRAITSRWITRPRLASVPSPPWGTCGLRTIIGFSRIGLVSSAASQHRPRRFPQDLQVER
jgi:hypothetical protein